MSLHSYTVLTAITIAVGAATVGAIPLPPTASGGPPMGLIGMRGPVIPTAHLTPQGAAPGVVTFADNVFDTDRVDVILDKQTDEHVLDHLGGEDHPLYDDQLEVQMEHYGKDIDVELAEEHGQDRLDHPELLPVSDEEVDIDFDVELAKRPPHWHIEEELDVEKSEERSPYLAFDTHVEQGLHSESDLHVVPAPNSAPEFDSQTLALSVKTSAQGGREDQLHIDVCQQDANDEIISASAATQQSPRSRPRSLTSSLNRRADSDAQLRQEAPVIFDKYMIQPYDRMTFTAKHLMEIRFDWHKFIRSSAGKYFLNIVIDQGNPYVLPYAKAYISTEYARYQWKSITQGVERWDLEIEKSGGLMKLADMTTLGKKVKHTELGDAMAQEEVAELFKRLVDRHQEYDAEHEDVHDSEPSEKYKDLVEEIFKELLQKNFDKLKPDWDSISSHSQQSTSLASH
ncbi:hypothetical protein F5880DRAFT_915218 [Lentinula raphanica]|nr:hypothetical protein F5880DRAFT_915218 [Lentinula raphanica]